ncbi:DUF4175 family protein [Zhouia amylolytica]|uniref:Glutamyl-tRNA synthetase n=1 Tax=Zhouia amylolytica AD3 TaxID=1286632 RepID=W2UL63_9FLAO|nr:DUF4175 family protein [Zhouia amylolytica]ETN94072.1 hypothetical protein P278_28760 [Zhouia amylolytica AD3]
MNDYKHIQQKLGQFIKRYHTNELIKGAILFATIFLLYGIITLLLEYFLWLNELGRSILFWLFISISFLLLIRFIGIPLFKLFKFKKGLDEKEASSIIGAYFPEVGDKLTNLLQLAKNEQKSDLLLASIEQKSLEINPIPFHLAVNFKANLKYIKYVFIPIGIILLFWVSGKITWFSDSYNRVIHYQTAYVPPAPFQFVILNDELTAIENETFNLRIQTVGELVPEDASIVIDDESYYLQKKADHTFQYTFNQPKEDLTFKIQSSDVVSTPYKLKVIKAPKILNFKLNIDYPAYTNKTDETLESTGNITVPEGSRISWEINAANTKSIQFITKDTVVSFAAKEKLFTYNKTVFSNFDYKLSTNNESLKNYEELGFSVKSEADQYPKINLKEVVDSTNTETIYYLGQVSDDYGLKKLEIVYYPTNQEEAKKALILPVKKANFDQFYYTFPSGLTLDDGVSYSYYFSITDNDPFRGGKKTKSKIFSYNRLLQSEREQQQLDQQRNSINNLDKTIKSTEEQKEELNKMLRLNKEKNNLNYSDKKKLENFIKRQKQQDELMKKFSKNLEDNLNDFEKEADKNEMNELLQERLERQQKELEKNEKLMEEIEKLSEKINKEELTKKLEELSKNNTNNKRNLEQLLELTKRYYVSSKTEKISKDLNELAKKQEELSKEKIDSLSKNKQQDIEEKYDNIKKQLDELEKENGALKKPFELERDKNLEQQTSDDLKNAGDEIQKQNNENAKKSQQNASQKMKKMAKQLSMSMQGSSTESLNEDVEMLRQILDNLLQFSLDQESLMDRFYNIEDDNPNIANYLKRQNDLRALFKHVDDSLFSLSLRQPKMSEVINKNITDVYYNIDKSLEAFAETNYYIGVSNQQYAITATNELSDFLSDILDNLQQSMSQGGGQGSGQEMQLPDIIQSQEQLNQQMQEGMQQQKEGEQGKEGEQEKGGSKQQNGNTLDEQMSEELYNLFQQQQELRQALEKQLNNKKGEGKSGNEEQLLRQMERIENDLLEKGFNNETLQRMIRLKHQLLKLDDATFQQGENKERKSETNTKNYTNNLQNQTPDIQQYFNQVEILNRQSLPLRQIYKRKVQQYFKTDD